MLRIFLRSLHIPGIGTGQIRCVSSSIPWQNIVKSHVPDVQYPTGNFINLAFSNINSWPNKTAFVCSESGRQITFSQLRDQTARWGGFLTRNKVNAGDVVTVVSKNCIEYAPVMLGTLAMGVQASTCNNSYTAEEIANQLFQTKPKVVVCCPTLESTVKESIKIFGHPVTIVTIGRSPSGSGANLHEILTDKNIPLADPVELRGDEVMTIPFSSGTTGKPKGVTLSHNAFNSNIVMGCHPSFINIPVATETHQEAIMGIMPKFHIYGMMMLFLSVYNGCKTVVVPKFDPDTFIDTIVEHQIPRLTLVPPLLNFLNNSKKCNSKTMSHVYTAVCAAAPVLLTAVEKFMEKVGRPVFFQEGYGMTEIMLTNITPIGSTRVGSTGMLIPNVQAKVVDTETGETLAANQNGEICIKTPSLMTGYINNPTATAEMIDLEGWAHTGDIGHYDEDHYFKIVDRTKELIKVKGFQVSPSELEDIIIQHPAVKDVGVVGVPHDRYGEAPLAYVVKKDESAKEDNIQHFLNSKVSKHKHLIGGVVFIDSIPKTATGKILRKDLKKMSTT